MASMILRCTKKVLDLLQVKPLVVSDAESGALLGDWYVNLLWIEGRKCLLATHAGTFFSILALDVRKAQVTDLGAFVGERVRGALAAERMSSDTFGPLESAGVKIAKTVNRVVLGVMNDQAWMMESTIMQRGGLARIDEASLNWQLRREINSPNDYLQPVAAARVWASPAP